MTVEVELKVGVVSNGKAEAVAVPPPTQTPEIP